MDGPYITVQTLKMEMKAGIRGFLQVRHLSEPLDLQPYGIPGAQRGSRSLSDHGPQWRAL